MAGLSVSRMHRLYPLLVPALVFLVHAPALDSGFHYDDQHSILDNPQPGLSPLA